MSLMTKTTILYQHEFASAHRLQGHPGKCAHLHGHNYIATFEIEDMKNSGDMVMDFGTVKKVIGQYIDRFYDHAVILDSKDRLYNAILQVDKKTRFVLLNERPTAEVIAKTLLNDCNAFLSAYNTPEVQYMIISVTIQESMGQSAVARLAE